MNGKQLLIRFGDELYSELNKEATAHRMTVQKYILAVLDSQLSLTRQIDRNVKQTLGDIYEERITDSISYGYLKRYLTQIDEKMNIILNALPNAKMLTDEEKAVVQNTSNRNEMATLEDIARGRDVFRVNLLYKMVSAEKGTKESEEKEEDEEE